MRYAILDASGHIRLRALPTLAAARRLCERGETVIIDPRCVTR